MKPKDFLKPSGESASFWYMHFTACMFQRYHKAKASQHYWFDRGTKIAVAVLAVAGLIASLIESQGHITASVIISAVAICVATALNIAPFTEREEMYLGFLGEWTDLREMLDALEQDIRRLPESQEIPSKYLDRLKKAISQKNEIDKREPKLTSWLHKKCYRDENARRWGPEVRTYQQLAAHVKKMAAEEATKSKNKAESVTA